MKRDIFFGIGAAVTAAFLIVCAVLFGADIAKMGESLTSNGIALMISSALFAIADIISAAVCILGKMKSGRSVIYSVTRLFIIVFCMNMKDKFFLFLPAAILNIIMYIISLMKDFRKFAARNSGNEVR